MRIEDWILIEYATGSGEVKFLLPREIGLEPLLKVAEVPHCDGETGVEVVNPRLKAATLRVVFVDGGSIEGEVDR